jgi:hypothetical protein
MRGLTAIRKWRFGAVRTGFDLETDIGCCLTSGVKRLIPRLLA